jgi:hypothetical protein
MIEITFGLNYDSEPQFNIRLRNRVEYASENSLFQLARKGKANEMKNLLAKRLASPHDISLRGGKTAFDVSCC